MTQKVSLLIATTLSRQILVYSVSYSMGTGSLTSIKRSKREAKQSPRNRMLQLLHYSKHFITHTRAIIRRVRKAL